MKKLFGLLVLITSFMSAPASAQGLDVSKFDPQNLLIMEVDYVTGQGQVVIMLKPGLAPNHVARIKELTRQGFYNGIIFHRVIEGFMAQTGDPKGDGTGGSGQNLKPEFNRMPHMRGTLSMARGDEEDSADSQFFICYNRNPGLDDKYTIWGRVIKGMDVVDMIPRGVPAPKPGKIITMRIASDIEDWVTTYTATKE